MGFIARFCDYPLPLWPRTVPCASPGGFTISPAYFGKAHQRQVESPSMPYEDHEEALAAATKALAELLKERERADQEITRLRQTIKNLVDLIGARKAGPVTGAFLAPEIGSIITCAGEEGIARSRVQGGLSSGGWSIDKEPDPSGIVNAAIERLIESGDFEERDDPASGEKILRWKKARSSKQNVQARPESILVVDGEPDIREVICRMLTDAGYTCGAVADGLEALALLESGEEFALLVCTPVDGIELLPGTKERFPDMAVVVATTIHQICVASACLQGGANEYLLKPFDRNGLLIAVSRALGHRRMKLRWRIAG
jgi:CheY-like chemotaxis protein